MDKKNNVFGSVSIILGAIIGAGFVTGKEIVVFFAEYGFLSILAVIPLFFILFYSIKLFLNNGKNQFNQPDNKRNKIVNAIYIITFLIFSATMISGIDGLWNNMVCSFNFRLWGLIGTILCFLCVVKGFNFLVNLNKILTSLIIIFVFAACVMSFFVGEKSSTIINFDFANIFYLIISIWLYVGVNLIVSSKVIKKVGCGLNKSQINKSAKISAGILCFFVAFIIITLLLNNNAYLFVEMPLVELSFSINSIFGNIFGVIVFLSIFTTLLTTVFSLSDFVSLRIESYKASVLLCCLFSYALSYFGFENIIKYAYPLIGLFGIYILYQGISHSKV